MNEITKSPLFGLSITVLSFYLSLLLFKKKKKPLLNPLLLSIIMIITTLAITKTPYQNYNEGGKFISVLISPIQMIVLASCLHKEFQLLKDNLIPIIISVVCGGIFVTIIIYILSKMVGLDDIIMYSSLPKSITTAIGIEIAQRYNWIVSITVLYIVITGISGAVISPYVVKFFKIKHDVSIGVSIGTAAHAIGTSKAIEMGEVEGAMSGVAIGLNAIVTSLWIPILLIFIK